MSEAGCQNLWGSKAESWCDRKDLSQKVAGGQKRGKRLQSRGLHRLQRDAVGGRQELDRSDRRSVLGSRGR